MQLVENSQCERVLLLKVNRGGQSISVTVQVVDGQETVANGHVRQPVGFGGIRVGRAGGVMDRRKGILIEDDRPDRN